ncbi:MAG: hypothetical protein FRX49_03240 [Trebouxia sp. A1-2]|nr:MAG: hypothetical protein FRX49_03240 [Trebouxia sp. A1-2]
MSKSRPTHQRLDWQLGQQPDSLTPPGAPPQPQPSQSRSMRADLVLTKLSRAPEGKASKAGPDHASVGPGPPGGHCATKSWKVRDHLSRSARRGGGSLEIMKMTLMGCTDHLGGVTSAISTALMPSAHTSTCHPSRAFLYRFSRQPGGRLVQGGVARGGRSMVGKTSQSLSTDVGDHVLVQGYIRGMHQICNTATPTILHHNPQGFTTTPAALPVAHL